jgi:hypothetical protein
MAGVGHTKGGLGLLKKKKTTFHHSKFKKWSVHD